MYASFLWISGALYLDLFEQPVKKEFFRILLNERRRGASKIIPMSGRL
jgi:hypothetical protein